MDKIFNLRSFQVFSILSPILVKIKLKDFLTKKNEKNRKKSTSLKNNTFFNKQIVFFSIIKF
jgi:hypothetical protein